MIHQGACCFILLSLCSADADAEHVPEKKEVTTHVTQTVFKSKFCNAVEC